MIEFKFSWIKIWKLRLQMFGNFVFAPIWWKAVLCKSYNDNRDCKCVDSVHATILGLLTKIQLGGGDMEVAKAMLFYYVVTSNVCLRHTSVKLFIVVQSW